MSKRKKKRQGRQYSGLDAHERAGRKLVPPLGKLDPWKLSSWVDDQLPEMLWAVLVVSVLPREHSLEVFRRVAGCAESRRDKLDSPFGVAHSALAQVDEEEFRRIVAAPLTHPWGRDALRPLLLFPDLPGYQRWEEVLACTASSEDWPTLGNAVLATLNHQSQEATDCRWLTVLFHMIAGKLVLRAGVEEIIRYPEYGDMRKVRPSIRAAEIAIRTRPDDVSPWPRIFWDRCFRETSCASGDGEPSGLAANVGTTLDRVQDIRDGLRDHLVNAAETTAVDARHDTCFGFCLYGLAILEELLQVGNSQAILGRLALRSLVETHITFRYLAKKDDPELWRSYRVYGAGQAKLAFLKLEEATGDIPGSIDKQALEILANEDMYQEFLSINLGHWDNSNLRKLAEEAACKDIYDAYYTWTSSYIHGHWGPMRDACFTTCVNPLHRLHRIPRPTTRTLEDVVPDACKLVDGILETLESVYPGFVARVTL